MAYMNQQRKAELAPSIKAICKKYGIKASIAVQHHSTLVLNIKSGDIDFIGNYVETTGKDTVPDYIQVNPYWYHDHFSGIALAFVKEVLEAMNVGNHDNSDMMSDYFDVGWYVDVNIGHWNQPYVITK